MTRLVIEVDEHPGWAECTKEAVAERLADLGGVRVVKCEVDKPQQMGMFARPDPVPKDVCPKCGKRIVPVQGPEGGVVMREIRPRSFWPDPAGPQWVMNIQEQWQRGSLEGDRNVEHTVGFPIHTCTKEETL